MDSGSHVDCAPPWFGKEFGIIPNTSNTIHALTASGGKIRHYGDRKVYMRTHGGQNLEVTFHIMDVVMPILSIGNRLKNGHSVNFNVDGTAKMTYSNGSEDILEKSGGVYILPVKIVAPITVAQMSSQSPKMILYEYACSEDSKL